MKHVKEDKRKQRHIERIIKRAQKHSHVAVGILQDEPHSDKFTVVDLAVTHEYGSKDGRVPKRSFMRSTCDKKRKEHLRRMYKLQWKILRGHLTAKQALMGLGEIVAKDMVQTINSGISPKLKPETIKRKKSSKSLIDTGRLKGSITHKIRGAA